MMKELRRKQVIRQVIYSWPSIVVATILTLLLAKGSFGLVVKERHSANKVSSLEAEAVVFDTREVELKDRIERLKTKEGIMEAIRDKFSVTRPGEFVAIIVDERAQISTSTSSTGSIKGLWQAFVNLFTR